MPSIFSHFVFLKFCVGCCLIVKGYINCDRNTHLLPVSIYQMKIAPTQNNLYHKIRKNIIFSFDQLFEQERFQRPILMLYLFFHHVVSLKQL